MTAHAADVPSPPAGRYELHCHLDGSVRLSTIVDLAREQDHEVPARIRDVGVAPADVGSLRAFLPYIDVALDVLQTPDALARVAEELVETWSLDGVVHGEVRFAPQLHRRRGMDIDDAIHAVARGLRRGTSRYGVRAALIVCCLRHEAPDVSLQVADAAVRNSGLVSGLDLAGDEGHRGGIHRAAFDLAREAGLGITVHAGEAAGPASVWEAIDVLGAERIGHGVRSITDAALVRRLAGDRIALETCPRCNVLTRAVATLREHPAPQLLQAGVLVTVSTDTRTTADTDLDREFRALDETFGWGRTEHDEVQAHARSAAFEAKFGHGL